MKKRVLPPCFLFLAAISLSRPAHAMEPIFGPLALTPANQVSASVFKSCETGAAFRLVAVNGPNGTARASGLMVRLNKAWLVSGPLFDEQVERLELPITVAAQNTIEIKVIGPPSAVVSVSIECSAGCLALTLAQLPPELVAESPFVVRGTIGGAIGGASEGPIGVTINGVAADLDQNNFAGIAHPPLGLSTLSIAATNACGHRATLTTDLVASPAADQVSWIQASPASRGLAPFQTTLKVRSFEDVSSISWDLDGDGVEDTMTTEASVVADYPNAGTFFPSARVTLESGGVLEATTVIHVDTRDTLALLVQPVWSQFVAALASGDVASAGALVESTKRATMIADLEAMRPQLATIAAALRGTVEIETVRNRRAFAVLRAGPPERPADFPVVFHVDADGRWRIQSP